MINKASIGLTIKIVGGAVASLVAFLSYFPLCPPNIFCTINPGIAMRFELMTLSVSLLAAGLLLSALRDVLNRTATLDINDHDVEAIADPTNENLAP